MSKFKIVGMVTLIAFAIGIVSMGDTVAAESGKLAFRHVLYITTIHTLKVPDVEGHTNVLYEAKGIDFYEKWGAALFVHTNSLDLIREQGHFKDTFIQPFLTAPLSP